MSEVALEVGRTPTWVMKNFTHPQLAIFYKNMKRVEFDFAELQARMVWAVGNGWKRPKQITADNLDALRATGMLKEV